VTQNELGEFALCLEEQVDYDEDEEEEDDDGHGHGHGGGGGHGGRRASFSDPHLDGKYGAGVGSSSSSAALKSEVYTPTVTVNRALEARQKKGCGFRVEALPEVVKGSYYDEYDADSDDEALVAALDRKYRKTKKPEPSGHSVMKSLSSPVRGVANSIRNSFLGGYVRVPSRHSTLASHAP